MTRVFYGAVRVVVALWIPCVAVVGCSAVWADQVVSGPIEEPGIHLSIGVLSVIVGIVAFVGPGFYLLGRYDHRLSANESALLHVERQMEHMVERSILTGDRIAAAVEKISEVELNINCPGPRRTLHED